MPYKNKEIQTWVLKEWREAHKEDLRWALQVWRESNREQMRKLNRKSYKRNKKFYSAVKKLKRKLEKEEID